MSKKNNFFASGYLQQNTLALLCQYVVLWFYGFMVMVITGNQAWTNAHPLPDCALDEDGHDTQP